MLLGVTYVVLIGVEHDLALVQEWGAGVAPEVPQICIITPDDEAVICRN